MKKLILTTVLSLFAISTNATAEMIDNPFQQDSIGNSGVLSKPFQTTHPLFVKGKGGKQCKNLPRTCGQMANCEQAKQALKCGNKRLDRDKDGVPCESICPGG